QARVVDADGQFQRCVATGPGRSHEAVLKAFHIMDLHAVALPNGSHQTVSSCGWGGKRKSRTRTARRPAPFVDLRTIDGHGRGRGDPEAGFVPLDRHDRDTDRAVDHDLFSNTSRQNQHGWYLFSASKRLYRYTAPMG